MEQIELCLLHVYSDSDLILQKAKEHTGHTSLGGQLLSAHPLWGGPDPPALPACLPASLPPPFQPRRGSGRTPDRGTLGTDTPGGRRRGTGAVSQRGML